MKKYYLHDGTENIGPFDIEELKAHNITRTTKVWFDEIEDWKNAEEIEELKTIFKSIPPPIKKKSTPPPVNSKPTEEISYMIFGLKKKTFFIIIVSLVLLLSLIIKIIHNYNIDKIEKGNIETSIYNEQLKIQNVEIANQKEIIAEKERLEQERIKREKQIALDKRIEEIVEEMNIAHEELNKSNKKLVDVTGFKFLRTSGERESQIMVTNEDISYWENEIEKLEKEMSRINPNWGVGI
jgi:tetrahydromethanopterin S-methyltransferase subunit B